MSILPVDSDERKKYPLFSGVWRYFPSALIGVSRVSYEGNAKHNPGKALQHDRAKSGDELDAHFRHLLEAECDCAEDLPDGVDPEDPVVWRVLSWSQKRKEARGAPIAPAAVNADVAIPPPPHYNPDDVAFRTSLESLRGPSVTLTEGHAVTNWHGDLQVMRDNKFAFFDGVWDAKRSGDIHADSVDIASGPLAGPEDRL